MIYNPYNDNNSYNFQVHNSQGKKLTITID